MYSPFYEKECEMPVLQCFSVMRTPLANKKEARAVRHVNIRSEGSDGGRRRDMSKGSGRGGGVSMKKNVKCRFYSVSVS